MKQHLLRDPTGYGRLVKDGHYAEAPSGLWGKYDNVRLFWENQVSRFALRPALTRLMEHVRGASRGLRVIDLGCGSGEGWDLLCKVPLSGGRGPLRYLLGAEDIASYHGIDLCPEMVAQCGERFSAQPQASFAQGNLQDLDRHLARLPPFDLYYNSYGSLSHLDDDGLGRAITAIARHQAGPCVAVVDVHGQYSPEWPGYWGYSLDAARPRMQPYNMVWMYPAAERERRLEEQRDYRIRYWGGAELRAFLGGRPGIGRRLRSLTLVDRSILVGRHMDTACFQPRVRPLRREVNALFEFNQAATADSLRAQPLPACGLADADAFFTGYIAAWNALVDWFNGVLQATRGPTPARLCAPGGPLPAVLRPGLEALARQARNLAWFDPGDPEANLLQPQFGLLLRQLEIHMQQGLGCGHGLVAIMELDAAGEGD